MEDFELRAPQWVDFTETHSPKPISDFFDKTCVHEPKKDLCDSNLENTENVQPAQPAQSHLDVTSAITVAQADLNILKNTPIKVISPKHRNNKEVIAKTTYDQVLSDAFKKLEFCKKQPKIREPLNKITQESNSFKTPNISKTAKLSRSIGCRSIPNKYLQSGQDSVTKSKKINRSICMPNNDTSAYTKATSINQAVFKQDGNLAENDDISKKPNNLTNDSKDKKEGNKECNEKNNEEHEKDIKTSDETDNKEEHNDEANKELQDKSEESIDNKEHNDEVNKELQNTSEESTDNKEIMEEDNQDDMDAAIEKDQTQSSKPVVLTWYNHRRSLSHKSRKSVNKKYVSMAEAVSRFQTETPERFRTRSSKSNVSKLLNVSKTMQNRLRPTIPISPALMSKTRARPVTVLSREEREKLEIEEMKKHQIKANPIPPNVLRGSRVVTRASNVAKKSTVAMNNSTQSNEKACATGVPQYKSPLPHRDKVFGSKNVVTKVLVTDPSGITVGCEEMLFLGVPTDTNVTKNATRIMPFSFEARNKDLQLKKEQRLKSLQEADKTKLEFHAKPMPNFSKPPTPKLQQPQQNAKRAILPCPFSFDDWNKKAFERKEQLVKQVLKEDKRARVFRANPAPIFKPVMVRGRSKENLLAKEKNTTGEQAEDQENKEPNIVSSKIKRENISKNAVCTIDKQKAPLKPYPLKLNTDKRAKERYEFNEKLKNKEMEMETKRQEAEKKRLEYEKEMKVKLRKLTEIKAKPMPAYKSSLIVKATKQLTNPQSPAFASKLRSKQT